MTAASRPSRPPLEPGASALVIVDVQNDYCHPDGALAHAGVDVSGTDDMVRGIERLRSAARACGVLTVFVVTEHHPEAQGGAWAARSTLGGQICRPGTFGAQHFGVVPADGDTVVTKHRYSGFFETRLESILRAAGVRTTVLTGTATNVCVMATAVEAVMRDYFVVVAEDATTAPPGSHEPALDHIRQFVGSVLTTSEVTSAWEAASGHAVVVSGRNAGE